MKLTWSDLKIPPINLYTVPKLWNYIINTKKKGKDGSIPTGNTQK